MRGPGSWSVPRAHGARLTDSCGCGTANDDASGTGEARRRATTMRETRRGGDGRGTAWRDGDGGGAEATGKARRVATLMDETRCNATATGQARCGTTAPRRRGGDRERDEAWCDDDPEARRRWGRRGAVRPVTATGDGPGSARGEVYGKRVLTVPTVQGSLSNCPPPPWGTNIYPRLAAGGVKLKVQGSLSSFFVDGGGELGFMSVACRV